MVAGAEISIESDNVTIKNLTVTNPELASYLASKESAEQPVAQDLWHENAWQCSSYWWA